MTHSPHWLSPREAADYLPGRPHINTIRRWMSQGVYGVRLRSRRIGGKRLTTIEWCDQFVAALAAASPDSAADATAQAELDSLGA